jgi:hypothetical protein
VGYRNDWYENYIQEIMSKEIFVRQTLNTGEEVVVHVITVGDVIAAAMEVGTTNPLAIAMFVTSRVILINGKAITYEELKEMEWSKVSPIVDIVSVQLNQKI